MSDYYNPTQHLGNPINHQKMYDFERDILKVKNPLNADFTFLYDGLPETVIANGTKDMERYKVRRYIWAIMGHIYNQITEAKFEKAHESFTRTHPDVIDDPYLVNEKIWLKLPRLDNPEFQQKIITDCIIGLVSKFGANRVMQNRQNQAQLDPNTPLFQQLIDDFKVTGVTDESTQPLATDPLPTQPATMEEVTL